MTVTALLVAHDGARWLPAVLAGLAGQQRRPDRILAVDTGSSDDSHELLVEALGAAVVSTCDGSFPEAVASLLPQIDTDWIWLLHDDANPEPGALAALLHEAEARGAAIAGPKLREWPSLRRLLEVGITISATGRRETGLERAEYDQGQHDAVRDVLAVNSAGMLIRRDALEQLGGFDPQLPLYGNDLDLGWRAAKAGLRTIVVPQAIVFHAEAAHRGVRRSALSGRRTRTHRYEREAALYTLLANTDRRRWLVWVRLVLGSLLRTVGFLLARLPGHAGDELVALVDTLMKPGRIRRARKMRAHLGGGDPAKVRSLLAPWWMPYRHGLDAVSDFAGAVVMESRDAAERRRVARADRLGIVEVDEDEEELGEDTGLVARLLTSPIAMGIVALMVLSLIAAREALGPLSGGALSPAPAMSGAWWHLIGDGWHQLGQGTDAPAPGYVLPFALVDILLPGPPAIVIQLLFLLAVPFAGWGAWRFLRTASELATGLRPAPVALLWGSAAYALVPAVSGAWGQGRFGVVAAAALLPWFAHAASFLFDPSADRRWRAAWRGAALLAVVTAFAPSAWLMVLLGVATVLGLGFVFARDLVARTHVWAPLVVLLAVPGALLLPGAVGLLGHDPAALFLEAGRLAPTPSGLDLAAGRLGAPAAPLWIGLLLVVPALLALLRRRTRASVLICWILVAVAAVLAGILSHVTVELPAGPVRPGLGFLVVMVQGALLTAAFIAVQGVRLDPRRVKPAERPGAAVGLVAAVIAVLVPVVGLGWWVFDGENELRRPGGGDVPAYMVQTAVAEPGNGVLVVRGDVTEGLTWLVHRGDGLTLGEDEVLALTGPDAEVDRAVASLVSRPTDQVLATLSGQGIEYVLLPPPVDSQVAATLDGATGLSQASPGNREARAWQLEQGGQDDAIDGDGPWWHLPLLALQLLALVVIAVLCGPTRREVEA